MPIHELVSRDRFAGCLVGQAAGDALGFPVEGCDARACREFLLSIDPVGATGALGRGRTAIGQYTDDTQLAREMLQSWTACGRFDPADYAKRIAAIFSEERIVGRGLATEQAALRLQRGVSWQESGEPAGQAGNGTAMRAAPVGLMCGARPEELVRTACEQSVITHRDSRCQAGSIAIAGAVALALEERPIDCGVFVARLVEWVRPVDVGLATGIGLLPSWLAGSPDMALAAIATYGRSKDVREAWPGISPFVVPSVLWSLFAFLRHPEDYWAAVTTAIEAGGDVDTTGAMTGALSGARLGLSAIPQWLARSVNDDGRWGYDDLVALAHRAHDSQVMA